MSVPILPPPGPTRPGIFVFGETGVWQHAVASFPRPTISASSKVITNMPLVLYAGDARIFGTHVARNLSAEMSPPGRPSLHGMSCPSSHTFGVMNERFGVFAA